MDQTTGAGHLYFRPFVSVQDVVNITQLSPPNANRLVGRLCDLGLLSEFTGQRRNRRFMYEPYVSLLVSPDV